MVTFNEGNDRGPQSFVRRLGRMRGVVNEKVTMVDKRGAAIDFRMGFPSNPLVLHTNRPGIVGDSSISLDSDNEVESFILRYPPLPAGVWQPASARELMRGMIAGTEYEGQIEVQINAGVGKGEVEEWWPHLLYLQMGSESQEYVLELIRMTLPVYLDRAKEKTQRLRKQNNG
jgi:hypothetical protein